MNVGSRIKEIRLAKNLSQKEVALSTGINRGQFSRIENDKVEPNLASLKKIAKVLGVSLAQLFDDNISYDMASYDRSLVEKIQLIEKLDSEQQKVLFYIADALASNQNFKNLLSSALKSA